MLDVIHNVMCNLYILNSEMLCTIKSGLFMSLRFSLFSIQTLSFDIYYILFFLIIKFVVYL